MGGRSESLGGTASGPDAWLVEHLEAGGQLTNCSGGGGGRQRREDPSGVQGAGKEDTPGESQHISKDPSESLGPAFPGPGPALALCLHRVPSTRHRAAGRAGRALSPQSCDGGPAKMQSKEQRPTAALCRGSHPPRLQGL